MPPDFRREVELALARTRYILVQAQQLSDDLLVLRIIKIVAMYETILKES